jgi:hypothetical protein
VIEFIIILENKHNVSTSDMKELYMKPKNTTERKGNNPYPNRRDNSQNNLSNKNAQSSSIIQSTGPLPIHRYMQSYSATQIPTSL